TTTLTGPVVMLGQDHALAACIVSGAAPVQVDCVTNTTTINSVFPANPPNDRTYSFTNSIVGTVSGGVTVDGFGLRLQTDSPGGSTITSTNNGNVSSNQAINGAVDLETVDGSISYFGNGSISASTADSIHSALNITVNGGAGTATIGSAATPVTPNFAGGTGISVSTLNGDQNVFLSGGTIAVGNGNPGGFGLAMTSVAAANMNVSVAGTSFVNTSGTNAVAGIVAASDSGNIVISSSATIGNLAAPFEAGIV